MFGQKLKINGGSVMGIGYAVPSGEIITGTPAAGYAGPCYLHGVDLISDGVNDPKVVLYDNASAASGTVLAELSFDVSVSGKFTKLLVFAKGIRCDYGIWAVVTGTGAKAIIYHEERG